MTLDHFAGCLLGGAVGDALGAAVQSMSLARIRAKFGVAGIREYGRAFGKTGGVTEATQMTLFTAEGLLRADNRGRVKGICSPPEIVHRAYLRWLETQGETPPYPSSSDRSGWLIEQPALHARRLPGGTGISALLTGVQGTIDAPINQSKGCGGVMRVAPLGLPRMANDPFSLGCDIAAITHGHPTGFLAAGFFATLIAEIVRGAPLDRAISLAREELRQRPNHEECLRAVDSAVRLARSAPATAESVETLGAGWVAEEALAIALFCSLTADRFEDGITLAVNHSGNSAATGSMTGNVLGASLGRAAVPPGWINGLELRAEIETIAADLFRHSDPKNRSGSDYESGVGDANVSCETDWARYPGW